MITGSGVSRTGAEGDIPILNRGAPLVSGGPWLGICDRCTHI